MQRIIGPHALETTDFTARQDLIGLEPGRDVFVRVTFQGLDNDRAISEPVAGRFIVPPAPLAAEGRTRGRARSDVVSCGAATPPARACGINPGFGGMKIYEAMRQRQPLFFIHSGDTIYADGPIPASLTPKTACVWTNLVTPQVAKVAETLDEFRGRYRYNLIDENLRRFNAEVPQIWQWDDHEVMQQLVGLARTCQTTPATPRRTCRCSSRAGARAFREYAPMRPFDARESQRVYRHFGYGPLLDVFVLDMRSYRGPNTANLQTNAERRHRLSRTRAAGLAEERGCSDSRAVWKVVAADMPLGLNVGDGELPSGQARWEAVANGEPGAPRVASWSSPSCSVTSSASACGTSSG